MAFAGKINQRDEIIKCGLDPKYFIRQYVKIKHPIRGLIPFKMFSYQDDLVDSYRDASVGGSGSRFNVVLKARQLGISEVTAAYALWLMLFHREKNVVVMASKAETAKNILRKITTAVKKIPRWLMLAEITTDNKLSIEFDNGSRCVAIATSEDAGRSEAVSFLIIDEAAFVTNLDELWTGLYPTVAAGGSCAMISTPNGVGNKFHSIYADAVEGENDFVPHKFMWWVHPERIEGLVDDPDRPGFKTSPWFVNEVKAANMSPRDVAQELECNFNASGDTVISPIMLKWIHDSCVEPLEKILPDRGLHVWSASRKDGRYFITADVARGDGRDNSAAHVWDIDSMAQCAEYYGKIPVNGFAEILVNLGRQYGDALLVVENATVGLACLEHVKAFGYPNVYYSRRGDQKPGEAVNSTWGTDDSELVVGFTTSSKVRPLMISKLEEFIRKRTIIIRSQRLHNELKTFIWEDGRPEAQRGSNDDLVMAAAIGVWIRDTFLSTIAASSEMTEKLLNNIGISRVLNNEIDGASKNPRDASNRPMGIYTPDPNYTIRLPHGRKINLGWLKG